MHNSSDLRDALRAQLDGSHQYYGKRICVIRRPGCLFERLSRKYESDGKPAAKRGDFCSGSDDVAGTRTELASFSTPYTTSSSLVDGATTTAEFTPTNGAVQYVLVYRGTIGAGNSTALDPVDANIAIAATRLCCVPDAGPSVPSPLKQDDDAVFGPVSVSDTTPVSAGYLSPGDYQIEYLDGVLDVWVDSSPDSHIAYVTYFISSPLGDSNVVIGVKSSGSGYLPGVAGESLGVYSAIDDIEAATLDLNPMTAFGWSGGEFFMFGSIEFGPEFFFGSSTSARYQIRRTAKPYAEPDRVRIKDWDALVKPQISTCSTCPNSSASEWGGTFPEQDGDWDLPHWTDSGAVALKGKAMGYPEIQYGATCWRLFFVCSNGDVIWSGRKDVGTDPTGTYIQDLDDAPDQCSVDLKCVVVESY